MKPRPPGHGEPDFIDDEPDDLIIGDPKTKRIHWNTPPTAAEKRGAPQSIPRAMWDRIADVCEPTPQGTFSASTTPSRRSEKISASSKAS